MEFSVPGTLRYERCVCVCIPAERMGCVSYYKLFDRPVEDVILTSVSFRPLHSSRNTLCPLGGTLLVEHLNHGTCVTGKELTAERKSPLRTNHCWCQLPAQSVTKQLIYKNRHAVGINNTHVRDSTEISVYHLWMKFNHKTFVR